MTTDTAAGGAGPVSGAATRAPRAALTVSHLGRRAALVVLVLVCLVSWFVFPSFGTADNIGNIAIQVSALALVALGMTFVIVTGGIDLSVGSVFALGGVLAAWGAQTSPWLAIALPVVACSLIGALHGTIIVATGMPPFIVTLAGLLGWRGLMLWLTDEGNTTHLVPGGTVFTWLGQGVVLGVPVPVILMVVAFAVGVVVLERTRYGRTLLAIGGGGDAARMMGLPVTSSTVRAYVFCGLLAGVAGAINAARLSSGVTIIGAGMELDAIAAVVIGGTLLTGGAGTVGGTLWGVLLLGVIQNLINQIGGLNSSLQSVVSAVFVILVVVAQEVLGRSRRAGRRRT